MSATEHCHKHQPVIVETRRGPMEVCERCGRIRTHSLTKFGAPRQWRDAFFDDDKQTVAAVLEVR